MSAELVTNESGLFTAPSLPAGTYTVDGDARGLRPIQANGHRVGTTETARVPVELTVSKVGETVEVSAEAPLLQTDRTSVSGAIDAEDDRSAAQHHAEPAACTRSFRPGR